jgi:hypothetical protein
MIIKHSSQEIQVIRKRSLKKAEIKTWIQYWIDKRSVELGMSSEKFIKEVLHK